METYIFLVPDFSQLDYSQPGFLYVVTSELINFDTMDFGDSVAEHSEQPGQPVNRIHESGNTPTEAETDTDEDAVEADPTRMRS